MERIYSKLIEDHFANNRQMVFLSGPRQVGKTTLAHGALPDAAYFNYDRTQDALAISSGAERIAAIADLPNPVKASHGILFDELHKFPKWKKFLKGFFDAYADNRKLKVVVTGSARMDVCKRGGDGMMGRYFAYRVHPFTIGERGGTDIDLNEQFRAPQTVSLDDLRRLMKFSGYPEPLIRGSERFYNQWKRSRLEKLFDEDVRDLSRVQDVYQVQRLAELLAARVSGGVNYASLAEDLSVSPPAVKNWLVLLQSVFYCYEVRPWSKNVASSIRKQPKIYLWDWSEVRDAGARRENFIASHLLKAVHFWTDAGRGDFGLHYLRDKMQREVDFLVSKDGKPFMLVECKSSRNEPLSPALVYFKKTLEVPLAWQVCFDMPQSGLDPTDAGLSPSRIAVADLLKVLV